MTSATALKAATPKPTPREKTWAAIRELRTFTVPDIEHRTRVAEKVIRRYVRCLHAGGYIEIQKEQEQGRHGKFAATTWRLIKDTGIEAPRLRPNGEEHTDGRGVEQIWRTIRILGRFTPTDVLIQGSTEECQLKRRHVNEYLSTLHKAGYLLCLESARGKCTHYRLVAGKHTGPKPPEIRFRRALYDPNLGKTVWTDGGDE